MCSVGTCEGVLQGRWARMCAVGTCEGVLQGRWARMVQ